MKRGLSDYSSDESNKSPLPNINNSAEPEFSVAANKIQKRKLDNAENQLAAAKKKIKVLQQSKQRLTKRNSDLKSVISELKRKSYVSDDSLGII